MGTRSLTIIQENNKNLVTIYQQYDGYLEGVGSNLYEFIQSGQLVNGFQINKTNQFNGMSCFAAQLVKYLKNGTGGTYLEAQVNPELYNGQYGTDYCYWIYKEDNEIKLKYKTTYENDNDWIEITNELLKG